MMNENRKYIILIFFSIPVLIFLVRLIYLQVITDTYKKYAYDNTTRRVIEYPYRGLIYDRNDQLLTYNNPVFDLIMDSKKNKITDTTLFLNLFNLKKKSLDSITDNNKKRNVPFIKEMSKSYFAKITPHLVRYPGFYVNSRTIRGYNHQSLSNVLGYLNEVSPYFLQKDSSNFYRPGDYVGIVGLENYYEKVLRGERGVEYRMVNVFGAYKGKYMEGKADTLSIPGDNLKLTIDLSLQQYAEKLMKNKRGSVVVIEPSTGEILTMLSSPSYSPNLLSGKKIGINFMKLQKDTLNPLLNRAIQSVYPPGSIFKTIQGLVGLQEGVITADESVFCDNRLIGDHAKPGYYNMVKALKYSSNNYFYKLFKRMIEGGRDENPFKDARLGLEIWRNYMLKFGLGSRLGIDIPNEKNGFIPNPEYYDRYYKKYGWRMSTIYSLSIGQGELQLTPIQMVNLATIIANRGWFITPHFIKKIGNSGQKPNKYKKINETGIDKQHFVPIIQGMVEALDGTAPRAIMKDIEICGKTGTVENPPLPDHSVFMCFAPRENPKIAISVYVENAGWGGRAAAGIASLLTEFYIKKKVERKSLEEYILKGDFL